MQNNENEDIKVIKYGQSDNNNKEEQKNGTNRENKNQDNNAKKKSKLRAQRTKAPKVYLQNMKNENSKRGGFSLFSCCFGANNEDDEDDNN